MTFVRIISLCFSARMAKRSHAPRLRSWQMRPPQVVTASYQKALGISEAELGDLHPITQQIKDELTNFTLANYHDQVLCIQ